MHKFYSPLEASTPSDEEETSHRPIVISLKSVSFSYGRDNGADDENQHFFLSPITGDIKKGDLICIEGPVGGGKTAFLNAINGNLNRISGFVCLQNIDEGICLAKLFFSSRN